MKKLTALLLGLSMLLTAPGFNGYVDAANTITSELAKPAEIVSPDAPIAAEIIGNQEALLNFNTPDPLIKVSDVNDVPTFTEPTAAKQTVQSDLRSKEIFKQKAPENQEARLLENQTPEPAAHAAPATALGSAKLAANPDAAAPAEERLAAVFDNAANHPEDAQAVETIAFRLHIQEPGVYLLVRDPKSGDDSTGQKLASSLDPKDVQAGLKVLAAEKENTLYVTGVPMGSEKEAEKNVRQLALAAGLNPGKTSIQILSVPRPWADGRWQALRDRIIYFFPSIRRDLQLPLRGEIISDAVTTAILEAPNAALLLYSLPRPDAWLVLGTHAFLIATYTLFQRSMTNWLLRGKADLLARQYSASLPFVLNYNILGNYSAIRAYHGPLGFHTIGMALAEFMLTQGLTLHLQTKFYGFVVLKGFRGWAANQKSPQDSTAARTWVSVLLLPWLWLDAICLAKAGTASAILFHLGPFFLTTGHVYLAALIALGSIFVHKPWLLDKTLPFYKKIRAACR